MFSAPTIAGAAFVLFSLYFLRRTLSALKQAESSSNWPAVIGKVLSSEAVQHSATSNHRHFRVKYQYAVKEQTYTSKRGAFYTLDGQEAQDLVMAHNKESRVSVYYNPDAPDQAVLIQGPRPEKKFSDIILASAGVAVSLLVLAGGLTGYLA